MYKFRDPTELRRLYKQETAAREAWNAGIDRMLKGDPIAKEKMPELTKAIEEAHRLFHEESQNFARSGSAM